MMTNRRKKPGSGFVHRGQRRIVVAFDDDTFDEVRVIAVRRGVSFGAVVRELVEFGLIDVAEAA